MAHIHEVKDGIQQAALHAWKSKDYRGSISGATGMGKSRIAVLAIQDLYDRLAASKRKPCIYLVTPTEAMRDENWPTEIGQWIKGKELDRVLGEVHFICYASLPKVTGQNIDLLILDEVHHFTELTNQLFYNNLIKSTLGLTATMPNMKREPQKAEILDKICPEVFSYDLDQGVEDGVVADYEIVVIHEGLDDIKKVITGGTKAKPFLTTEKKQYDYLTTMVKKMMATGNQIAIKTWTLKRTRFFSELPSKIELANAILKQIPDETRMLVFCGGIEQSRKLFGENVYNSKDKRAGMLDEFKKGNINRLGVVNAVDEGHNIPFLDMAIIVQASSNPRTMIQRIGRTVRYRDGHRALILILCTDGTVDSNWIAKALEPFDPEKVTHVHSRDIYTGKFFENRI